MIFSMFSLRLCYNLRIKVFHSLKAEFPYIKEKGDTPTNSWNWMTPHSCDSKWLNWVSVK